MKKLILIKFIILFILGLSFSETISLKDGSIIIGEIKEINDEIVIIETSYGEIEINKENIKKIYTKNEVSEDEEKKSFNLECALVLNLRTHIQWF